MRRIIIISLLSLVLLPMAMAEDTKVIRAKAEVALDKMTDELNAKCGSKISANVDWKTFDDASLQKYSMPSFCGTPIESLAKLCVGKQTKSFVKSNVKNITCRYGGKDKRSLSVKNGNIIYNVDFNAANASEYGHAELLKNL